MKNEGRDSTMDHCTYMTGCDKVVYGHEQSRFIDFFKLVNRQQLRWYGSVILRCKKNQSRAGAFLRFYQLGEFSRQQIVRSIVQSAIQRFAP